MHSLDKGILPTRKKMGNPFPILCCVTQLKASDNTRKGQWSETRLKTWHEETSWSRIDWTSPQSYSWETGAKKNHLIQLKCKLRVKICGHNNTFEAPNRYAIASLLESVIKELLSKNNGQIVFPHYFLGNLGCSFHGFEQSFGHFNKKCVKLIRNKFGMNLLIPNVWNISKYNYGELCGSLQMCVLFRVFLWWCCCGFVVFFYFYIYCVSTMMQKTSDCSVNR